MGTLFRLHVARVTFVGALSSGARRLIHDCTAATVAGHTEPGSLRGIPLPYGAWFPESSVSLT